MEEEKKEKVTHTVSWTPLVWAISIIGVIFVTAYIGFIVYVLTGGMS